MSKCEIFERGKRKGLELPPSCLAPSGQAFLLGRACEPKYSCIITQSTSGRASFRMETVVNAQKIRRKIPRCPLPSA
eukprot:1319774-Amorphochlora_amoeboformis.AAC.2